MADTEEGSGEEKRCATQHAAALYDALDGEKKPAGTGTAIGTMIQMDKCVPESDPSGAADGAAAVNGMHRLSDEYVWFVLSMPREYRDDAVPYYERCSTLAEVRGEEWLQKQRRRSKERAARSRRIHDEFVQFQNWVFKEWLHKGYVEVDEEFLTNAEKLDEYGREVWEELIKKRDTPITFADGDDGPADAYPYVPFDPVEQARVLLADVNWSSEEDD